MEQLQALGQPAVQQPALGRGGALVRGRAQQVVPEPVSGTRRQQDAQAPQLVDGVHQLGGLQVPRLAEQVQADVVPEGRREFRDVPGLRAQPLHAPSQQRAEPRLRKRLRLRKRARGLQDVERVAARGRLQQPRFGLVQRAPADVPGQLAACRGVEGCDTHFPQQPGAARPLEQARHGRGSAFPAGAQGRRNQQVRGPAGSQQEGQPGGGVRVAPLQVIEHKQGGPAGGLHRRGKRLEEPEPLPGIDHGPPGPVPGRGVRGFQQVRQHIRQQPGRLAPKRRGQGGQHRGEVPAAQPHRHRRQRDPARRVHAPGLGNHRARGPGQVAQRRGKMRLADARCAGKHQQAPAARAGFLPALPQHGHLPGPSDRRVPGARPRASATPAAGVRLGPSRLRVSADGATPSSRSSTAVQRWKACSAAARSPRARWARISPL